VNSGFWRLVLLRPVVQSAETRHNEHGRADCAGNDNFLPVLAARPGHRLSPQVAVESDDVLRRAAHAFGVHIARTMAGTCG